jgi:hypothetical protein
MIEKPKPISIKSRKAKARGLQNEIKDDIQRCFHLSDFDVKSSSMGLQGADIQLSMEAKRRFNFAIECKHRNSLNIWAALEQAQNHSKTDSTKPIPLMVFKRDRSAIYVALKWDDFLKIYMKQM